MRRFLILVLFTVLFFSGCASKETLGETSLEKENNPIEIGMIFDTFVVERWQRDRDVFVSTAMDLGAEVNVQNANGDVKEQIAQMDYFIDKKDAENRRLFWIIYLIIRRRVDPRMLEMAN